MSVSFRLLRFWGVRLCLIAGILLAFNARAMALQNNDPGKAIAQEVDKIIGEVRQTVDRAVDQARVDFNVPEASTANLATLVDYIWAPPSLESSSDARLSPRVVHTELLIQNRVDGGCDFDDGSILITQPPDGRYTVLVSGQPVEFNAIAVRFEAQSTAPFVIRPVGIPRGVGKAVRASDRPLPASVGWAQQSSALVEFRPSDIPAGSHRIWFQVDQGTEAIALHTLTIEKRLQETPGFAPVAAPGIDTGPVVTTPPETPPGVDIPQPPVVVEPPPPGPTVELPSSPPKVGGKWDSNLNRRYEIVQSGNDFTWTIPGIVPGTTERGTGVIDGANLSASWSDGIGSGSGKAVIKEVDANGNALRIEWDNGVVFTRQAAQPGKISSDVPTKGKSSD